MSIKTRATIEDLYKAEGKAELVKRGRAFADNKGFHVHLPHRESFSPYAAYHVGPRTGMRFLEGVPIFAVEVRSEYDYGPAADTRHSREARRLLRLWHSCRVGC